MPFYVYEAEDAYGKSATGILESPNPAALRDQLSTTGFRLTSIKIQPGAGMTGEWTPGGATTAVHAPAAGLAAGSVPPGAAPPPGGYPGGAGSQPGGPVAAPAAHGRQRSSQYCLSIRSHAILFREFAAAFRSGMTAFAACDMIGGRYRTGPLAQLLQWVKGQTQAGMGFADALESSPVTLNESSIGIIRAGERGGFLPYVLDELGASYERQQSIENKLKPMKIVYLGIVVPLLILVWPVGSITEGAVDAFNKGANSSSQTLGAGMQRYSEQFMHFCLPAFAILIFGWLAWKYWTRTAVGARSADALSLKVPLLGGMQRSFCLARFTRVLAHLYRGGCPLREAWELSAGSVPNIVIREKLQAQEPLVAASQPLSVAMTATRLFDEGEVSMVATGERSGEVDAMLFRLASYEEESLDRSTGMIGWAVRALFLLTLAPIVIVVIRHAAVVYMQGLMRIGDGG